MGVLSKKIKKISLLVCALVNAVMPVMLVSDVPVPLAAVVSANIACSVCMLVFSRSDDIESVVTDRTMPDSREPSSFETITEMTT